MDNPSTGIDSRGVQFFLAISQSTSLSIVAFLEISFNFPLPTYPIANSPATYSVNLIHLVQKMHLVIAVLISGDKYLSSTVLLYSLYLPKS